MPELPEVQTVVNDLMAAGIVGTTIKTARVFWPRTIAEPSAQIFCRRIIGRRVAAVRRRAKFIVFDFAGGGHLLVHLRMTGRLLLTSTALKRSKHQHVILGLENRRQLRFQDTRKFGRLYLVENTEKILGHLGPEPLADGFSAKNLAASLNATQRILKPLLLDQRFIAGLGNIYVDEALWESQIHPQRSSASLSEKEIRALHRAIRRVLRRGLQNLGTTLGTGQANFYSIAYNRGRNSDELKVFRRTDEPCPRCKTEITRIVVGQRSTHICPECQKLERSN